MNQEAPKSSGELHIERMMQELDPASERYRVLDTAKRFKSSWVELGEQLLRVNQGGAFRQWGYETFEDYCAREIRIKKPTAQKLTRAYHYLEKEEPELLARRTELKPLPDYRSVDLLRQARQEQDFPAEDYANLRQAIVEEERSLPTVRKRFNELAAAHSGAAPDPTNSCKTALAAARRLATALRQLAAPPAPLLEQADGIVATLENELERLAPQEE